MKLFVLQRQADTTNYAVIDISRSDSLDRPAKPVQQDP
jgi:hypothetical protein